MGRNFRDIFDEFDPERRSHIEAAAEAKHREYCADRQEIIVLDDAAFERFLDVLQQPAAPSPRLRKLMAKKPIWES